jgi:hypothetical protein
MFATVYECTYGTYVRMAIQKTFDAILVTPVNINDLILGELIWGSTKSGTCSLCGRFHTRIFDMGHAYCFFYAPVSFDYCL